MGNLLLAEGLHKAFAGFPALRGATLEVRTGEVVAVIGPNGAGKTTLFHLITGVLQPDRGRVVFEGREITRWPAHHRCALGIGRTFQIANIFPRLRVFDNVHVAVLSRHRKTFHPALPASRFAAREVWAILEHVGLADKAHHPAGTLSHGDQRTLEIAIALAGRPKLLVLDEPTAGMSPEETEATLRLLARLNQEEGLTVLFCEHDMEVVFATAHRIAVMHQGRTVIQGSPEEVRRHPEVQAAYLGSGDA